MKDLLTNPFAWVMLLFLIEMARQGWWEWHQ